MSDQKQIEVTSKKSILEYAGKIILDISKVAGIFVSLTIIAGTIIKFIIDKRR
jgi:hypothetical protein